MELEKLAADHWEEGVVPAAIGRGDQVWRHERSDAHPLKWNRALLGEAERGVVFFRLADQDEESLPQECSRWTAVDRLKFSLGHFDQGGAMAEGQQKTGGHHADIVVAGHSRAVLPLLRAEKLAAGPWQRIGPGAKQVHPGAERSQKQFLGGDRLGPIIPDGCIR